MQTEICKLTYANGNLQIKIYKLIFANRNMKTEILELKYANPNLKPKSTNEILETNVCKPNQAISICKLKYVN